MSEELDQAKEAMARAVKALDQDFSKLNTGRPSASILDNVKVDYYGVATPVSQVGAIKIPEGNLMTIEPWDKSPARPCRRRPSSPPIWASRPITMVPASFACRSPLPPRNVVARSSRSARPLPRTAALPCAMPPRCQEQDRAPQEGRRDQRG